MKKLIILCFAVMAGIQLHAQQILKTQTVPYPYDQVMNNVFQNVDMTSVTSHHLLDRAYKLMNIEACTGTSLTTDNMLTYDTWCRMYGTLFSAAWQNQYRLPAPANSYKPIVNGITQANAVPILLLHYNYHKIKSNAVSSNLLSTQNCNVPHCLDRIL